MIFGCKEEDAPEPEYVTRTIKYQVTSNFTGNFNVQHYDSNGNFSPQSVKLPWEKTIYVTIKKGTSFDAQLFASCVSNTSIIAKIFVDNIEVTSKSGTYSPQSSNTTVSIFCKVYTNRVYIY